MNNISDSKRRYFPVLAFLLLPFTQAGAVSAFDKGMYALLDGNYAEAYCVWKPLAHNGNPHAQYNLGWLYANGNGLKVDMVAAVLWWREAAAQGYADAQFAVGMAYTTGEGIKRDIKEAMRWYIAAAIQGLEDAREIIFLLGEDPDLDVVRDFPELLQYDWFGRQATIEKDAINVRKLPGTDAQIIARLNKGDSIRVVQQRADWSLAVLPSHPQQKEDPATGWIFSSLIKYSD